MSPSRQTNALVLTVQVKKNRNIYKRSPQKPKKTGSHHNKLESLTRHETSITVILHVSACAVTVPAYVIPP